MRKSLTIRLSRLVAAIGLALTFSASPSELLAGDYGVWTNNLGVVTWAGTAGAFVSQDFYLFDAATGSDTPTKVNGNVAVTTLPGYLGESVRLRYVFLDSGSGNKYKDPGYAVRFAPGSATKTIDAACNFFHLGGLIVEPGATGYNFTSAAANRRTRLGDTRGADGIESWFSFGESFTFKRGKEGSTPSTTTNSCEFLLYGKLNFDIAEGQTVDLNSALPIYPDLQPGATFRMHGKGSLKVLGLKATGDVALDFSDQDAARATPYIDGNLIVDGSTLLVLPTNLQENVAFKLCSGTLTAPDGERMGPATVDGKKTMVIIKYDTAAGTVSWRQGLLPDADRTVVPAGYSLDIPVSLDPLNPYVWGGDLVINGTLAIGGYANFEGELALNGEMVIDPSRFASAGDEPIALVNVSDGASIDVGRIRCLDAGKWDVSLSGNTIYIVRGGYSHWQANPGVFTWAGNTLLFKNASFKTFDLDTLEDGKTYVGTSSYEDVPGQKGMLVNPFWSIFTEGKTCIAPGYVLRFTADSGAVGAVDAQFAKLNLGGLIVEGGATGRSIASTSTGEARSTFIGDTTGGKETWVSVRDDFAIERAGGAGTVARFCGKVNLEVATGKTFGFNVTSAVPVELDGRTAAELKFRGNGSLSVGSLCATNAVSLNFSALAAKRLTPFIDGALSVDDGTIFRFPADLAEDQEFKLCSKTLTVLGDNPPRFFYVGDAPVFATLEFDAGATPKTVKYTGVGNVNRATLTNDVVWTDIVWNDGAGWKADCPALLTLADDVRVSFNASVIGDVDVVVVGEHVLSLVCGRAVPGFASLRTFDGASCIYVIPENSTAFPETDALTIPAGENWVIEGSSAENYPKVWTGAVTIRGNATTRGHLEFSNAGNTVVAGATLRVDTGSLRLNGAQNGVSGAVFIEPEARLTVTRAADLLNAGGSPTIDVRGELAMPNSRLTLSSKTTLNLYAGGAITGDGDGNGALDFNQMPQLAVRAAEGASTATLSAAIRYRANVTIPVDAGVTLDVTSTNSIGYANYSVTMAGAGTVNLRRDALVPFATTGFCVGGFTGTGTAFFKGVPPAAALKNIPDVLLWTGTVAFSGVSLSAFDPNLYGNAESTVRLIGCVGGFKAGDLKVVPAFEMAAGTAGGASFKVTSGTAGSRIEIPTLTGDGQLVLGDTTAAGVYGIFLPNAMQVEPSISVENAACKAAVVAGAGSAEFAGDLAAHAGAILVVGGGSARIGDGATWRAANGIEVPDSATLVIDGGRIGGKVRGGGTVRYEGDVSNEAVEEAAGFDDPASWTGTVSFEGAYFHSTSFTHIGNDSSAVKFSQTDLCSATAVVWPDVLTVDAEVGDILMVFDVKPTPGFDRVTVRRAGETWRQFGLAYDDDIRSVYLVAKTAPPTLTLAGCRVDYGVDLATAYFVVSIEDYVPGSGYEDVAAVLTVFDADGSAIEQRGLFIDGDGDYTFDGVRMRGGRESGYSYSVTLTTKRGPGEKEEVLAVGSTVDFAVRRNSRTDWVKEDAVSFAATDPALKTGDWTGDGSVKDGKILVGDEESIGNLNFSAYDTSDQAVVNMDVKYEIHEYGTVDVSEIPDDVQMLLTVMGDGYDGLCFGAWSAKDRKFIKLFGAGAKLRPEEGETCLVRASFNYKMGVVSFSMNGDALTNAQGSAFVPLMKPGLDKLSGMRFRGAGSIERMDGDQMNGDLAALVDGGVTTRYGTVDEAVDAAGGTSSKVTLLWDASWHPSTNSLGKTVSYDGGTEGYRLYIDPASESDLERKGYVVVRNEDGSYSVGIVTFTLSFDANGGKGEMPSIPFTATNAVFRLIANAFTKTASDFACWNASPDGTGPTNYEDEAVIDMTPYGATDVTLYARWKIASRRFTVATPDPRVYIEQVETNDAIHAGVTYYRRDTPGEAASAVFNVEDGSRVIVRFSTDIETNLTPYAFIDYKRVDSPTNIPYAELPKLPGTLGALSLASLSKIERWAVSRGITLSSLAASSFKTASYGLDSDGLIDSSSEVQISDFTVTEGGCAFKVSLDGKPVSDRAALASMVMLSDDLTHWTKAPADRIRLDGEKVYVETEGLGKFVKIVIPKD